MREIMHSVGIDVGTTTTQVLFSRLVLENTASSVSVPQVRIVERKVFYASPVHFTPLLDGETIDAQTLRRLVEAEYAAAGIQPGDIAAGAVIITGETARKKNAESVLHSLAGLAGEFVVTSAGSDLESLLAGCGAGTADVSRSVPGILANLDIGGGTTNIALFRDGEILDTSCLDIGGRHVCLDPRTMVISSITPQYRKLIAALGLPLHEKEAAHVDDLRKLTARCAELMAEMLRLLPRSHELEALITNKDFREPPVLAGITLSGGVAAALLAAEARPPLGNEELFAYGDIGILQGMSLRDSALCRSLPVHAAKETIRATVVGVGVHMMELSGSTVFYSHAEALPLKNIPVVKLSLEEERAGGATLAEALRVKNSWFAEDGRPRCTGIALCGRSNPSFEEVWTLADALVEGAQEQIKATNTLVVLVQNDMAKALGTALYAKLGAKTDIYCLDAVQVQSGDYIDIGKPVAGGRVLPVMAKTLLFGR